MSSTCYLRTIADSVLVFLQLKTLSQPTLEEYLSALDTHMGTELESLRKRYHQKRLPILQAMDAKKKQQFRS